MIMTTVIYLVDNFILCLYSLYAVCCWIGGWLIWFHRLWKPKATGQRNNGSAVHWRHRIVPTRKCQIHESIVNLAVNLLLREIKLCSFTNLISQKFSDSALLLAIAVWSLHSRLASCEHTRFCLPTFGHSRKVFTALVDFGAPFSINFLSSSDIFRLLKSYGTRPHVLFG